MLPNKTFNFDEVILEVPEKTGSTKLCVRDFVCNTAIFGLTGSGKSSGSSRHILLKFLAADFGGLILTVKPTDREDIEEYCRLTNRTKELVIVGPNSKNYFNFLDYECKRSQFDGRSITQNIVQCLKAVIEAGEVKKEGIGNDPFWTQSLDQLITAVVDLCLLAYDTVSVQKMYDIVISAPKKEVSSRTGYENTVYQANDFNKAFKLAQSKVEKKIDEWERSETFRKIPDIANPDVYHAHLNEAIPDARTFKAVDQFFIESFRDLNSKTRTIIEFSFSTFLSRLLQYPLYSLFCSNPSTVTPEDCLDGKIILLDIPVKIFMEFGIIAQMIFKFLWQRSMESRSIKDNSRPCFLHIDEAQLFIDPNDSTFLSTARSSLVASVYITQNLNSYYSAMGGRHSEHRVKNLLGNFAIKILHCNSDIDTNQWASLLIGDAYTEDFSQSASMGGQNHSWTHGSSYKLERMVRPEAFSSLLNGSALNNYIVQAYIHIQGKTFSDGLNFKRISFNQRFIINQ